MALTKGMHRVEGYHSWGQLFSYMEGAGREQAATALWLSAEPGWGWTLVSRTGARSARSQSGVALRLPPQSI